MSQSYVGQIILFAGNYAPQGFAFCNGQEMGIADYETLFALIGTTYGGDGVSTFKLPNLQGCVPVGIGAGTGGTSNWVIGMSAGSENVVLNPSQLPPHTHPLQATSEKATLLTPAGSTLAADAGAADDLSFSADASALTPFMATAVSMEGGSQPHDNVAPYLALNYIIALQGVFPSPN